MKQNEYVKNLNNLFEYYNTLENSEIILASTNNVEINMYNL